MQRDFRGDCTTRQVTPNRRTNQLRRHFMAAVIMQKWVGFTPDQYDAVRDIVGWNVQNPDGMLLHVASFDDDALTMTDVWDSAEQFMAFVQMQIMPAVTQLGIAGQPEVAVSPLYELTGGTVGTVSLTDL
jgi:hypothetical protein